MSELIDDPALRARCGTGETVWEWTSDDKVAFQRPCPDCRAGLLECPARFCGRCGGSGFLVRVEDRR